jgi:hypothetical protein
VPPLLLAMAITLTTFPSPMQPEYHWDSRVRILPSSIVARLVYQVYKNLPIRLEEECCFCRPFTAGARESYSPI